MHLLLRYCTKNLSIGVSYGALLNQFWNFEYVTSEPFAGLLSANFTHVQKSSTKIFGHLYFEF